MLKLTKLGEMVKSLSSKENFLLDRLLDEEWMKVYPDAINIPSLKEAKESLKEKGLIEEV